MGLSVHMTALQCISTMWTEWLATHKICAACTSALQQQKLHGVGVTMPDRQVQRLHALLQEDTECEKQVTTNLVKRPHHCSDHAVHHMPVMKSKKLPAHVGVRKSCVCKGVVRVLCLATRHAIPDIWHPICVEVPCAFLMAAILQQA